MPLGASLRWWSSCAVLIAACSGSHAESRQLTELTATELDAQCHEWDSRATGDPDALEGFCRLRGAGRVLLDPQLSSMDPIVACETETERCLTAPPVEVCFGELRSECMASVDEIGSCVDVRVSRWRMAASRSCEEELVRLMNMRQAQQLGMPLPDPTADACHEADECFVPMVTIGPGGGSGAGGSGAGGMTGSTGGITASTGTGGMGGAGTGGTSTGSPMPDPTCMAEYPNPDQECASCVCSPQAPSGTPGAGCLGLYRNCFENPDPMFAMRCGALVACTIGASCVGSACYAPDLCMTEIEAAAMVPSGGTLASCSMGAMDSSACRGATLLNACAQYDATMRDGPCRQACM